MKEIYEPKFVEKLFDKMLGIYTEAFGNSKNAFQIFKRDNFEVEYINYFYGCATGIKGRKIK